MFSVRLWKIPVSSFMESDFSIKTVEVEFCAGGFFFKINFWIY